MKGRKEEKRQKKHTLDDGDDGTLLNSRGTLITSSINTTEKLVVQLHVIERRHGGIFGVDGD